MNKSLTTLIALAAAAWLLPGPGGTALGNDIVSVEPVDAAEPPALTAEQLEELVGPVALYPDDLLAIVLPAATYPLDVVKAARFLEERDADSSIEPDEAWDESVIALLNYPEVLSLLNSDLDWTWTLGEAVLYQEEDLIAAVEEFRSRAYEAGNLNSDSRQDVIVDDGAITIAPVDREVIYVPYYEPREVVVVSRAPVYHYYPRPYPVYYYPYAANHYFSRGFFWGVSTAFHISFNSRALRLHHYSYASHPYFGRRYFPGFYRYHRFHFSAPSYRHAYQASYRSNYHVVTRNRSYSGDRWRGSYRTGVRPREYNHYNYPQRSASRSAVTTHRYASDRSATRTRTTTTARTTTTRTTTTRPTSSGRPYTSSRTTSRNDAARNSTRSRDDAARNTTRSRSGSAQSSSSRRSTANSYNDRRTAATPSRNASNRQSSARAQTSRGDSNASRSQTRERSSSSQRSASRERSASSNRSSSASRQATPNRSSSSRRSSSGNSESGRVSRR
ncbi:MAG: DUF3300 domain-containing protein [Pseudomonadota bacterium]